ncbi:hypothetical protein CMV_016994 [Castanea mollissima]|uniref:Benzyl alcohol O-benzoyltransferase n=1 Tax=Castanea mollissima TaxID=60419 RepID=A0A8J4QTN4_9ROSI|nr:hypothetical protein CMV_016994 [Castanea mollissima]
MSDAPGVVQFMKAVGEMARGASSPSILPVWQRHLLQAMDPPHVTCTHREYDEIVADTIISIPVDDNMAHSLHTKPHEVVRVLCIVNARAKFDPPLPTGYYGNVFAFSVALTTAGKLCENPLGYAVELVKKVKDSVTEEYRRSVSDLMVIKGRPHFYGVGLYVVSSVARAKFGEVDYGWGKSVYGGPAKGEVGAILGESCFQIPGKNSKGEDGIMVLISLPVQAMERFLKQLDCVLKDQQVTAKKSKFIVSSL